MAKNTARKYFKTKYEGVFYRESAKIDKKSGTQDKIYCFHYTDALGKGHWKTVGRHSDGIRPADARQERSKFMAFVANNGSDPVATAQFTVGQAVDLYVEWVKANGKTLNGAHHSYMYHLHPKIGSMPIANITPRFVTGLKADLMQAKRAQVKEDPVYKNPNPFKRTTLSNGTIANIFQYVAAAINRSIKNEVWTGKNPFVASAWYTRGMLENGRLRFLTKEEAKALLEDLSFRNPQLHDMVLLSLRTGLRPTEMFRLRGEDIVAEAGVINVLAKGRKRQPIKVPQNIIEMLLAYDRAPNEHIFQTPVTKQPFTHTPGCFQTAIRDLKLGPADGNPLYQITLHTMRHTFASWLAQSGKVSLLELQKLMRHETIRMTMRYAHLMPGQETQKLSIIEDMLA